LERLPIEKTVFDISNGWASAISEMLRIIKKGLVSRRILGLPS
jgi:hypothetical protein